MHNLKEHNLNTCDNSKLFFPFYVYSENIRKMAHLLSELTNDVYDLRGADLGPDPDFIGDDGIGFMMLGIFVSIIPKVRYWGHIYVV